MSATQPVRSIPAASLFAAAVALAACHGHLDFGLGRGDAGDGGATTRDAGMDVSSDGAGGGGRTGGAGGGSGSSGAGGEGGGSGCGADGDCRSATLHCDVAGDRTCVECVTDDHCARSGGAAGGSGGGPRCDPKLRRCVMCLTSAQCPAAQACVGGRCIPTCVEDASPSTCATGSKCESGLCVECEPDEANVCATTPGTRFCLASPKICVACRADADCGAGTRCDPVRKACAACVAAADCPASNPLCDLTTGTCF